MKMFEIGENVGNTLRRIGAILIFIGGLLMMGILTLIVLVCGSSAISVVFKGLHYAFFYSSNAIDWFWTYLAKWMHSLPGSASAVIFIMYLLMAGYGVAYFLQWLVNRLDKDNEPFFPFFILK